MADTKISALTAATTPLAGTEVLPIVQSGVTKQVSVADLTAGRAVSALSLTLTNALTAANGGTGQSSYTIGDLLYASGATALSKLADVATGNALISGGVGVAPSWGKIGLTTHVSGTLAVSNGGTGNTTGAATAVTSNATSGVMQILGPAAAATRVMTIPDADFTVARTDAAQTFSGLQTFGGGVTVTAGGLFTKNNTSGADTTFFNSNTTGTGANFMQIVNGGGTTAFGLENSASTYWGTPAYSFTIAIPSTRSFVVFAGGVGRLLQADASTQNVTFNMGNLIQGTANKGINFTANSAAAGMTSQLLNWYEEGTWTLGLTTAGGNFTSISVNAQTCKYTRIGRTVVVSGSFYTSGTVSGGSGQVYITGLPYSGSDTGIGRVWVNPDTANYSSPSALPTGGIVSGTQFRLFKNGTTNNPAFNSTDLATSGNANNIYFTVSYQV